MKRMIRNMLVVMVGGFILIMLVLATFLYTNIFMEEYRKQSILFFTQVEYMLEQNSAELETEIKDYKQICLNSADAVAYILNENPAIIEDRDELNRIAEFLHVDEIHIFNDKGEIVAGTEPRYYGYTVYDGEQISYFAAMLDDKELRLCQDVTPNTAEGKEMQYVAVWSLDKTYFIQLGSKPERVLEAVRKNQLSYIFSLLAAGHVSLLYAVDCDTGEILGATDTDAIGQSIENFGIESNRLVQEESEFFYIFSGEKYFCVSHKYDNIILLRCKKTADLFANLDVEVCVVGVCLIIIAISMVWLIDGFLEKHIISGIERINKILTEDEVGQMLEVNNTPEFKDLCECINNMKRSLIGTIEKMSYVLDRASLPMGVYEYDNNTNRVNVTKQVISILNLEKEEADALCRDCFEFETYINKIQENPIDEYSNTYRLVTDAERYVRIENFEKNGEIVGILIDVTNNVIRNRKITNERDTDMLTGIYNRRALENILDEIYDDTEKIKHSALIMLDADGLKQINDRYGHEKGDEYLCEIVRQTQRILPDTAIFSRQGGDEFVIFYYGCESDEELLAYIDALNKLRGNTLFYVSEDKAINLEFSYGYTLCFGRTEGYFDLLREADLKMYQNKKERKSSMKVKAL